MGIVTDVQWICPGCGAKNIAQLYDDCYDESKHWDEDKGYMPLLVHEIPDDADLKWNPLCTECGEFKLKQRNTFHVEQYREYI